MIYTCQKQYDNTTAFHKHSGYVKLTNHNEIHRRVQYKTGLNIDSLPFSKEKKCSRGGIYICKKEDIHKWIQYSDDIGLMHWMRHVVEIPKDAQVYDEGNKLKVSKVILGEREPIPEEYYIKYINEENTNIYDLQELLKTHQTNLICLASVQRYSELLQYIENQTPEICLAAVKQNGYALQFVNNQTPEICLAAVNEYGCALQFVKNQTPEICLAAVQQNGRALKYVHDRTYEICLAAVRQDGYALFYIDHQTDELCLAAVCRYGYVVRYVKNQTPEICLAAVQQDGRALKYVHDQTPEICLAAVQQDSRALKFVKNQISEIVSSRCLLTNENESI